MSWSDYRNNGKHQERDKKSRLEAIGVVNAILAQMANDEDLHEDFEVPAVKIALQHWTGKNRLDAEKASKLTENSRVISVLQKIQRLQHACSLIPMPVPLDHVLNKSCSLQSDLVEKYFGLECAPSVKEQPPLAQVPALAQAPVPASMPSSKVSPLKTSSEIVPSGETDRTVIYIISGVIALLCIALGLSKSMF